MRVALFPSAFHPSLGGVEELVRQLALRLKATGHDVVVHTNRWPRDLPARSDVDGLEVHRFAARVPATTMRSKVNAKLSRRPVLAGLVRRLRAQRVEVVNAHCVSCVTGYALDAAAALDVPAVVTLQGELTMDANRIFERADVAEGLRQALLRADAVTAVSGKTLEDAERFTGMDLGKKGRVIFNGANPEDFAGPSHPPAEQERPYAFALGRMVHQKGFDLLLQAFADADRPDLDLVLAGDGPDLEALRRQSADLKLTDRVRFVGRQDHGEVVRWLLGCRMFVLPSRTDEGLPVVVAEALNAGVPVIATRSGGTPEVIVDEESGLLLDMGDQAQLTAALRRVDAEEGLRGRLAEGASEVAVKVSWHQLAEQYLEVYETLCGGKRTAGPAAAGAVRGLSVSQMSPGVGR